MEAHCSTCTCHKPIKGVKRAKKILAPRVGEKITPARAAALRKLNAELCGCPLCYWSINPAMTEVEHQARMTSTLHMNETNTWPPHKDWAALKAAGLAQ